MDLTNLENALNNSNFKEQVYCSLEGVYQISKVLNQLDLLKNFSDHDLEITGKIEAIKNALSGYETSFLNNASFRDLTTQSIRQLGFYKHSQAIVYEVLE